MSPSPLFLLLAFLFMTLVASGAVDHDDSPSSIASALLDAASGGSTAVGSSPKAGKMKSSSAFNATSNSTASSASGHRKSTSSNRPSVPATPSAAFTAGLASIVPVTAVLITLAMIGFRLYLNKIEDESYNVHDEKDPEWAKPRAELEYNPIYEKEAGWPKPRPELATRKNHMN